MNNSVNNVSASVAIVDICRRKSDLYDVDGNYIKSVCQISNELSHSGAMQFCRDNRMELFIIDDTRTETALYHFADSVWSKYFGAALWVNGKWRYRYTDGFTWYTENSWRNSTDPVDSGLTWNRDLNVYEDEDEDVSYYANSCLRTSNIRGDFSLDAFDCDREMTAFCEYDCRGGSLCKETALTQESPTQYHTGNKTKTAKEIDMDTMEKESTSNASRMIRISIANVLLVTLVALK